MEVCTMSYELSLICTGASLVHLSFERIRSNPQPAMSRSTQYHSIANNQPSEYPTIPRLTTLFTSLHPRHIQRRAAPKTACLSKRRALFTTPRLIPRYTIPKRRISQHRTATTTTANTTTTLPLEPPSPDLLPTLHRQRSRLRRQR